VRDFALLLRATAWPAIALLALLLFRRQLRSVIVEFSEKLKRASRLKIKVLGLELAEGSGARNDQRSGDKRDY
jgi:hypothetical protein